MSNTLPSERTNALDYVPPTSASSSALKWAASPTLDHAIRQGFRYPCQLAVGFYQRSKWYCLQQVLASPVTIKQYKPVSVIDVPVMSGKNVRIQDFGSPFMCDTGLF
jgi:hypothetical protein